MSHSNVTHLRRNINVYDMLPSFIQDALNDMEVEEISADANGKVTTVGPRGREQIGTMTNVQRTIFLNAAAFSGQESSKALLFSPEHPFLSVMLPNGERLEGQHGCISIDGCSFSLRKFGDIMRLSEFTRQGMITKEQEEFLRATVGRENIIVAGETRCGKTTFVKALIEEIQNTIRWVAIEKNTELQQPKFGNRIFVNKITTFEEAIQSALRYDPTLIVISEINSQDSAFSYVEAAMTGHYGLSTIHAGSAGMVQGRMRMRLAKYDIPDDYIAIACRVVVHIALRPDNSRFVTEIIGM